MKLFVDIKEGPQRCVLAGNLLPVPLVLFSKFTVDEVLDSVDLSLHLLLGGLQLVL